MDETVAPLLPRNDGKLYADDLTVMQFMAVMDRFKKNNHQCPVCSTAQWLVQLDGDSKPVIAALPSYRDESDRVLTFFMGCVNCGYIRSHVAENICVLASKLK